MLPQLQAEQQLLSIEAASVPHMKDDTRKSVFRRLADAVRGHGGPVKARSAVEALTAAGIPIIEVTKGTKNVPVRAGTRRDTTTTGGEPS